MRKPHMDLRSKKYAARQFVSDYELPPRQEMEMPSNLSSNVQPSARVEGIVKFFDKARGYGFAKRAGFPDVWFHAKALERASITELSPGDKIEFDLVPNDKGGKAVNIKIVSANG